MKIRRYPDDVPRDDQECLVYDVVWRPAVFLAEVPYKEGDMALNPDQWRFIPGSLRAPAQKLRYWLPMPSYPKEGEQP